MTEDHESFEPVSLESLVHDYRYQAVLRIFDVQIELSALAAGIAVVADFYNTAPPLVEHISNIGMEWLPHSNESKKNYREGNIEIVQSETKKILSKLVPIFADRVYTRLVDGIDIRECVQKNTARIDD